jgi:hypothetical protein
MQPKQCRVDSRFLEAFGCHMAGSVSRAAARPHGVTSSPNVETALDSATRDEFDSWSRNASGHDEFEPKTPRPCRQAERRKPTRPPRTAKCTRVARRMTIGEALRAKVRTRDRGIFRLRTAQGLGAPDGLAIASLMAERSGWRSMEQ